jgi:hypothetical protein
MMVTLWTPEFTLEKLRTADFWLQQALKTIVALVAYFAFIYFSSTVTKRGREYEMLRYQVQQNYDFVILNLLTDTRDVFVDLKNNIEKGKAYLNYLDYRLRRLKTPETNENAIAKVKAQRDKINEEKTAVALFIRSMQEKLSSSGIITEHEKQNNEKAFNINGIKNVRYFKIDKRLLDGSNAAQSGKVLGYFNNAKHIVEDVALKLIPSMLFITLVSIILPGMFKDDSSAIQAAVYLSFIVLINCLFGWLEGHTLVTKYGRAALNEIKEFYGDFFNYCVNVNKLNKERLISHNEKLANDALKIFEVVEKKKGA